MIKEMNTYVPIQSLILTAELFIFTNMYVQVKSKGKELDRELLRRKDTTCLIEGSWLSKMND